MQVQDKARGQLRPGLQRQHLEAWLVSPGLAADTLGHQEHDGLKVGSRVGLT